MNPKLPAITIPPESQPVIIIDTREQDPLPIEFEHIRKSMTSGDYTYLGGEERFCVERKSLADLVGCLGADRERFQRQLERLRAFEFRRLLIIGSFADLRAGNYRSRLDPLAATNSLHAIEARYCPVVWCSSPSVAARKLEQWAFWHYRELIKAAGRIAK